MFKQLTAVALCASLALTSFTAPARADAEDVAKVLGGLALLFAIGAAVENDRKPRTHHVTPTPPRHQGHPPRRAKKVAPSVCFRRLTSVKGQTVRGYAARCMQNRVKRAGSLPPECIRRVRTNDGRRTVYGGRCLANKGWVRG